MAVIDTREVLFDGIANRQLAFTRRVQEIPEMLDENAHAVRKEVLGRKWALLAELPLDIAHSLADFLKPRSELPKRVEHVYLDDVVKRERRTFGISDLDNGFERETHSLEPSTDCRAGDRQVAGHLGDAVVGQLSRIASAVDLGDLSHGGCEFTGARS